MPPTAAVVGGGFTGLLAARRLRAAGVATVVLEASGRPGGQLRTVELAGSPVDVGAEAMHLGAPGAAELLDELGLLDDAVTARTGTSWLLTPRGLRPLPAGVGPAGPTRLRPVVRSRVMNLRGLARAGMEPLLTRTGRVSPLGEGADISVGDFVAARFGDQVADRFVDPLLGSLHAGDVRALSLRACAPALVPTAIAGTSLVVRRHGRSAPRMSFVTWPEGLVRVVDRLVGEPGADVRTGTVVRSLERRGGRWRLHTARTEDCGVRGSVAPGARDSGAVGTIDVDGVVLAVGSAVAAQLLHDGVPTAADLLAATARADVATVLLALPREQVADVRALTGTGVLVPSSAGSLLKAATFLSTKWAHLDLPHTVLVRLSAGRAGDGRLAELDDDELVSRLRDDLATFTGIDATPDELHVERWPAAMPQLTIGHTGRLASARTALAVHAPGVVLAGASYDGIGLASCAGSARRAADALLTHLQPSKDLG